MKKYPQKIALAGFGVEGKATLAYLKDKVEEIHIFDEQDVVCDESGVVVYKGLNIPADIEVVYKTPGIPTNKLKLASENTEISSQTNIFLEEVAGMVIGITGTKGKSTVASLIYHILKKAGKDVHLVGNIGTPPLELLKTDTKERIYVYEMSSFQCEHLKMSPQIAVITNIFPEHLNHHPNFEAYREAKLNIARFQNEDDIFVNAYDETTHFEGRMFVPDMTLHFETKLLGTHNQKNCTVAFLVAKELGLKESEIQKSITSFEPLPYRLEDIGTYKGITFYDDALATIPEATMTSIESVSDIDTIILGGLDRGLNFSEFAKYLATTNIQTFIIFPETGEKMVTEVRDRTIIKASNMEEAVKACFAHAKKAVLFSAASSSFNMFQNYQDRSEQLRKAVKKFGV